MNTIIGIAVAAAITGILGTLGKNYNAVCGAIILLAVCALAFLYRLAGGG